MKQSKIQKRLDRIIEKLFVRHIPLWVKPNYLTLLRIISVPIIYYLLQIGQAHIALILFVLSACTDFLDGSLARTRNLITDTGKILDPIADKGLIVVVLIFIGWRNLVVTVFLIVIAFEVVGNITQALFSKYLGRPIPANVFGKIKMILQSLCVIFFLLSTLTKNPFLLHLTKYTLYLALFFAVIASIEQSRRAFIRQFMRIKGRDVSY